MNDRWKYRLKNTSYIFFLWYIYFVQISEVTIQLSAHLTSHGAVMWWEPETRRHARTRHMWPGTSGRIGAGAYPHTHSWHPRILDLKNMPGAENWHLRTSLALKSHTNTRKILSCCTNNWCGNCWLIKFSLWIKESSLFLCSFVIKIAASQRDL